jgi:FkbM family methyltransferase
MMSRGKLKFWERHALAIWVANYHCWRMMWRGEKEIRLLAAIVPPTLAVDVGANLGIYTISLADYASRVVAYEPNPWMAAHLKRLRHGKIEVREAAVSDTNGCATLYVPSDREGWRLRHERGSIVSAEKQDCEAIQVARRRLDDEKLQDVGFIKIDVEGHEYTVLRGAAGIINRDRPLILLEVRKDEADKRWHIAQFAQEMHYQGFEYLDGYLEPVPQTLVSQRRNILLAPVKWQPSHKVKRISS